MTTQNKALVFAEVPTGTPVPGKHLKVVDRPIDLSNTQVPEGGLLVKNHYASFDPYQRGRMRAPETKSYSAPFTLNEPIDNSSISTVIRSKNSTFKEGDLLNLYFCGPTEEYSILDGKTCKSGAVTKIDAPKGIDVRHYIGSLGMPGLTAYSSLYEIGQPKKGQTIFISAASGAVGQLVGQLAKHEGLHVIGSVGSDEKLDFIMKELKFGSGFNYKKEKTSDALTRLAPNGVDIYYDNVGGETLEAAIAAMNDHGTIIACGMISQYSLPPSEQYGIKNTMLMVGKRLKMQGFIVNDKNMGPRYAAEHKKNVENWLLDGTMIAKFSETHGMDDSANGFVSMLGGGNFGKAVLAISPI